jgi:hypothetical protein
MIHSEVLENWTIHDVNIKIRDKTGIPLEPQSLIYATQDATLEKDDVSSTTFE